MLIASYASPVILLWWALTQAISSYPLFVTLITSITPSSRPTRILLEALSKLNVMAYLGYPLDQTLLNLELSGPKAHAYTLPTYIKLFPASFYQGSFVFETLAFNLDIGFISAVTM